MAFVVFAIVILGLELFYEHGKKLLHRPTNKMTVPTNRRGYE